MTTFFWVSVLVLASIIGNIMWLRPSSSDRALIKQRDFAKAQGLTVNLRVAPEWLGQKPGQGLIAQYRYPLTQKPAALGRWRWHEGLLNWQPLDDKTAWLTPPPWPATPTPAPRARPPSAAGAARCGPTMPPATSHWHPTELTAVLTRPLTRVCSAIVSSLMPPHSANIGPCFPSLPEAGASCGCWLDCDWPESELAHPPRAAIIPAAATARAAIPRVAVMGTCYFSQHAL